MTTNIFTYLCGSMGGNSGFAASASSNILDNVFKPLSTLKHVWSAGI